MSFSPLLISLTNHACLTFHFLIIFPFGVDAFCPLQCGFSFLFSALQIGGSYWSGIPVRYWEKQLKEQDGCS
jgi:hypothetical protein